MRDDLAHLGDREQPLPQAAVGAGYDQTAEPRVVKRTKRFGGPTPFSVGDLAAGGDDGARDFPGSAKDLIQRGQHAQSR